MTAAASRPLGDFTDRAWLAGWDAAVAGLPRTGNPYRRRPQRRAWDAGWAAGRRSGELDATIMQRRANRIAERRGKPAAYPAPGRVDMHGPRSDPGKGEAMTTRTTKSAEAAGGAVSVLQARLDAMTEACAALLVCTDERETMVARRYWLENWPSAVSQKGRQAAVARAEAFAADFAAAKTEAGRAA